MVKKYFVYLMLTGLFLTVPAGAAGLEAGKDIELISSPPALAMNLTEALKQRRSTHEFTSKKLSVKDLSAILWAANGINRENGKRTAPTAMGKYFIDLYVAADQGVYKYDPALNRLKWISAENIKDRIGRKPEVATASHVLMMVADLQLFPSSMARETQLAMANGTAGTIAENVYLAAAALKLGTCLMGGIADSVIKEALNLTSDEVPLYIMTLGYPK